MSLNFTDIIYLGKAVPGSGGGGGGGGAVSSVNGQTGDVVITGNDVLPDQTGHSGDFLMTDGTDASWSSSKKGDFEIWRSGAAQSYALKLGINPSSSATSPNRGVRLAGGDNKLKILQWGTGNNAALEADVVEPGAGSSKTLGTSSSNNSSWNNVYTKKINAGSGAGDITVPAVAGSMAVQVSTVPTAGSTLEGQIYQYIGATDSTYTHGHLYECVSDGQDPATYSWTEVQLGGGGSSYTAGTGIDITSGVISVTSPTLQNTATGTKSVSIAGTASTSYGTVNVGIDSDATGSYGVAIGHKAVGKGISIGYHTKSEVNCVAIGDSTQITSGQGSVCVGGGITTNKANTIMVGGFLSGGAVDTILIGFGQNTSNLATNSESGTMAVALRKNGVSATYKLLDYDGTIPADRHAALPAADGTYTLQLVIADGVPTLSWVAV